MREIYLSKRSESAQVDDSDYERLAVYKWKLVDKNGRLYAMRHTTLAVDGVIGNAIYMERVVLNVFDRLVRIDHWNGNGLNNQRANLRICSPIENFRNSGPRKHKVSCPYKGVTPRHGKWVAAIFFNSKQHYLGTFNSVEDAAVAYDCAAKEAYGDFAWLNFPPAGYIQAPRRS